MPKETQSRTRSRGSSSLSGSKGLFSRRARNIIDGLNEAAAHMRGEIVLPVRRVKVPDRINVREIRSALGLSQSDFAKRFGFNPRSLQDWEQGRRAPEGATRAYLTVIQRNPRAVEEALAG